MEEEVPISGNSEEFELDEEEEEPITAKKVLDTLRQAWLNEKFAPDLLLHQTDMLDLMLAQVSYMEENLRHLESNDFRGIIHRMELERIKYIICCYLRCRLAKIEEFTDFILAEEAKREEKLLSEEEFTYATTFSNITKKHFEQIVLKYVPTLRDDCAQNLPRPNEMSHVFLTANKDVPSVIVGSNDEEVDLQIGSRHIMPYKLAADLLKNGDVQLL
ncbi:DNA replication complex GINS protein SLD5 [Pseudolycoriella hygida]|uniref:DNA replication complex GINS protein SLD5 n=1 Tax=Pseudolycoriella hygida TaxID=35572 RepID=A0A9Q0MSA7_9DIPT|nr:DNA replication complex GINS protein SLD5 [Pseudolycoriella hygida]